MGDGFKIYLIYDKSSDDITKVHQITKLIQKMNHSLSFNSMTTIQSRFSRTLNREQIPMLCVLQNSRNRWVVVSFKKRHKLTEQEAKVYLMYFCLILKIKIMHLLSNGKLNTVLFLHLTTWTLMREY